MHNALSHSLKRHFILLMFALLSMVSFCIPRAYSAPPPQVVILPDLYFFSQEIRPLDRLQKLTKVVVLPSADEEDDDVDEIFHVTDSDVLQLEAMKSLEELEFRQMDISAEQLARLKKLPNLRSIEFQGVRNADKKAAVLAQFPALENLTIFDGDLTDDAAPMIGKMKKLKSLTLEDCNLTTQLFSQTPCPSSLKSLTIVADGDSTEFFAVSKFNGGLESVGYSDVNGFDRTRTTEAFEASFQSMIDNLRKSKNLKDAYISDISHYHQRILRQQFPNVSINGETASAEGK